MTKTDVKFFFVKLKSFIPCTLISALQDWDVAQNTQEFVLPWREAEDVTSTAGSFSKLFLLDGILCRTFMTEEKRDYGTSETQGGALNMLVKGEGRREGRSTKL